jgi:hypothetical protein
MNLHRLDLCTLTVESAWRKYLELRSTNRCAAVMALRKHFERIDERALAKGLVGFYQRNPLRPHGKGEGALDSLPRRQAIGERSARKGDIRRRTVFGPSGNLIDAAAEFTGAAPGRPVTGGLHVGRPCGEISGGHSVSSSAGAGSMCGACCLLW